MMDKPVVLMVDDDPVIQEFVAMALMDEGYDVMLASNGKQALERIHERRPALVLLDLMMPIMDGWQLLRQVNETPTLQDIPIILLSANPEIGLTAQQEHVQGFLPKPFDLNILLDSVEKHL
jgi:two-component system, chemotaxis family, chemotaxis protein CheY